MRNWISISYNYITSILAFRTQVRREFKYLRTEVIDKISQYVEMDREALLEKRVEAFLRERKRNLMLEKYQILSRYDVPKTEELEKKIKSGDVKEHPAWEDLITLENLDNAISHLDEYLRDLQKTA